MTTENKTVTIQAEHKFGDSEMAALGRLMASKCQDRQRLEDQLSSIKKDFGAKIQSVELDVDLTAQKLRDGFEMRPTQAIVAFGDPRPGRKTFYQTEFAVDGTLVAIREEAMDATDFQRVLPLDETPSEVSLSPAMVPSIDAALEHFPEVGDSAKEVAQAREIIETAGEQIGTSLAQKLVDAAQGAVLARVVIDFSDKDGWNKCLAKFRQAARKQEWPEACIDLIDGVAQSASEGDARGAKNRVLGVLRAHSISKAAKGELDSLGGAQPDAEKLASTFGTSEHGE